MLHGKISVQERLIIRSLAMVRLVFGNKSQPQHENHPTPLCDIALFFFYDAQGFACSPIEQFFWLHLYMVFCNVLCVWRSLGRKHLKKPNVMLQIMAFL